MFKLDTYSLYNKVICFIVITGVITGIFGGSSVTVLTEDWTMASTVVMCSIWAITAFVALILHGQKLLLSRLKNLVSIQEKMLYDESEKE